MALKWVDHIHAPLKFQEFTFAQFRQLSLCTSSSVRAIKYKRELYMYVDDKRLVLII